MLTFLCGISIADAQHFVEKSNKSPLPVNTTITSIASDSLGFLWISTQNGVYRFDGKEFEIYNPLNCPQLFSNRFGTNATLANGSASTWLLIDNQQHLYTVDGTGYLTRYATPAGQHFFRGANYFTLLSGEQYHRLDTFRRKLKEIWVEKDSTIFCWLANNTLIRVTPGHAVPVTGRIWNNVLRYKGLYYLADHDRIAIYNPQDNRLDWLNITGYKNVRLVDAMPGHRPLLWTAGCLYEMQLRGEGACQLQLLSVSEDTVAPVCVFYSRERQIMLQGTGQRELREYAYCQYRNIAAGKNIQDNDDYLYAISPDSGNIITATTSAIFRLHLTDGKSEPLIQGRINSFSVVGDHAGRIWYQDHKARCIYVYNTAAARQARVLALRDYELFTDILHDDSGDLFLTTTKRVFRLKEYAGDSFDVKQIYAVRNDSTALRAAFLYSRDHIWFGTDVTLLDFNTTSGTIKSIPLPYPVETRTFYRANDTTLLIGTYNQGIICFKGGHFYLLDRFLKEPVVNANGFLEDTQGRIWVSSNNGVFRISLDEILRFTGGPGQVIQPVQFTGFDVLASNEFNGSGNSAAALADTCFAFANARGIVLFNPLQLRTAALPDGIFFRTGMPGSSRNNIVCRYGTAIKFKPQIAYFSNRANVHLYYRLNNEDSWNELQGDKEIFFVGLQPGDYTLSFKIMQAGENGAKYYTSPFTIRVLPLWYQTWLFRTLLALLITASIWMLVWIRIKSLKRNNRRMHEMVQERTKELHMTMEQLQDTVHQLQVSEQELIESSRLKSQYYALLSHDLRSPLKYVALTLHHLKTNIATLPAESAERNLDVIHNSAHEIYNMVDQFALWIRSNDKALQIHRSEVNICRLFGDVQRLYNSAQSFKDVLLNIEADPDLVFYTDADLLHIIIRNALDNALKNSATGPILLAAAILPAGYLQLTIKDTGMGMTPEKAAALNNMQYQDEPPELSNHQSLGFQTILLLTRKLDGHYLINSVPGYGTEITFTFKNHTAP